jgi:hypothetical protein
VNRPEARVNSTRQGRLHAADIDRLSHQNAAFSAYRPIVWAWCQDAKCFTVVQRFPTNLADDFQSGIRREGVEVGE